MYEVFIDNQLLYSPERETDGYQIFNTKLTMEFNKSGSFEFSVPITNPMYDKFVMLDTIVTVERDKKEIWRGRPLSYKKDLYLSKQILCEGELGFLNDYDIPPYDFSESGGIEPYRILALILDVYIDTSLQNPKRAIKRYAPSDMWNIEQFPSLSQYRFYERDDEFSNPITTLEKFLSGIPVFIKFAERDYSDPSFPYGIGQVYIAGLEEHRFSSNQTIEFGKNIISIEETIDSSNLVTGIRPLGSLKAKKTKAEDRYNLESLSYDDGTYRIAYGPSPRYGQFIEDKEASETYGKIYKTVIFEGVKTSTELIEKAIEYLKNLKTMTTNISIKAVDLSLLDGSIDTVNIGDFVRIISEPHGINSNSVCSKIVIDLENPQNNEYTFGLLFETLTEKMAMTEKLSSSAMTSALAAINQGS